MTYVSNYDFINSVEHSHYDNTSGNISGYIDLKITTISNLYIGSGFHSVNGRNLYSVPVTFQDEYIIPGSSFKGAVRNIAASISKSCIDFKCRTDADKESNVACITCNMFGFAGQASKVIFPDFKAIKAKTETLDLNMQYGPNNKHKNYIDKYGKSKGFKFYKTHCEKYNNNHGIQVKTVTRDSEFSGRIYFSRLTEEQLSLLLFSMGIDESFDIKLGGFKNEGLGHVQVRVMDSDINIDKSIEDLCFQYPKRHGKEQISRINKLRKILKP